VRHFYEEVCQSLTTSHAKTLAVNYICSDLVGVLGQESSDTEKISSLSASSFAKLITMIEEGVLSSRGGKDVLVEWVATGKDPREIATEKGLIQNSNKDALRTIVAEVIAQHTSVVEEYRNGKAQSLQFLVGQGMRLSKGSANPALLKEVILEQLGEA
jgi:aspartyl-tRNA(Asn)/glutamyl-tRNA(Gln) amidotransferase subunit B